MSNTNNNRKNNNRTNYKKQKQNYMKWFYKEWRPTMAIIYMVLCILDYGVRPVVNYYESKVNETNNIPIEELQDLDPQVQRELINNWDDNAINIEPILNEVVHVAFGAIIGVSAYGRSQEILNRSNNNEQNSV